MNQTKMEMSHKNNRGFLGRGTLMGIAITAVLMMVLTLFLAGFKTIEGNQIGVEETMTGGVSPDPLLPKMYFFNRFTTTIFPYDVSGKTFVMDTNAPKTFEAEGWDMDTLEVKSADNQKIHVNSRVRWRLDPTKIILIHKTYRNAVEENLIRPEIVRVVTARMTVLPAINLYSGESQNRVRESIETELRDPNGELAQKGIIVDSFVFDKVEFPNADYVNNIEARQLAIIRESRAREDIKANLAEAEAAEAKAQREAKERVVKAEADKAVALLAQEATSQQTVIKAKADAENTIITQKAESEKVVIAAKAEAERNIAISEAQKQADINRAVGIEAIGRAEAEAQKLRLSAYAVSGADAFTKIEISKNLGLALGNVRFFPSNATYNTVARDFMSGVGLIVNGSETPATK